MKKSSMRTIILKKIFAAIILGSILAGYFWIAAIPYPAKAQMAVFDAGMNSMMSTYLTNYNTVNAKALGLSAGQSVSQSGILTMDTVIKAIQSQDFWIKLGKELAYQAWMALRKMLLRMLVNDIINWIQGNGKPRFVQDWQGFLKTAADKAGGQFVDQYLQAGFLCEPFQPQLQFALSAVPTFDESVKCSLSDMGRNISNFFANFSNGGWKSWITVTETQNNIYGAYLMAMDKKMEVMSEAAKAAENEGLASQGFLGDKVCTKLYEQANPKNVVEAYNDPTPQDQMPPGWVCAEWSTVTPGSIAADATQQAVTIDIPWLISAQEFRAYASAIIDAFVNRVFKEGLALLRTNSYPYSSPSPPPTADPTNQVIAITSGAVANNLPDQLRLTKENLNKVLTEYQNNLSYLNQISAVQINAVNTAQQLIQSNCSLPAGVTQTILNNQQTTNCDGTTCPCTTTTVTKTMTSLPGIGDITASRTTTRDYDLDIYNTYTCTLTVNSSDNSVILSSNTSVGTEILGITASINATTNQINQADSVSAAVQNYMAASDAYTAAWNADPSVSKDSPQTITAQTTMEATKATAVASLQSFLGSTSTDINALLTDAQNLSQTLTQQIYNLQEKRGTNFSSSCAYASAGTYFKTLCDTQTVQANLQNSLTNCQASFSAGSP